MRNGFKLKKRGIDRNNRSLLRAHACVRLGWEGVYVIDGIEAVVEALPVIHRSFDGGPVHGNVSSAPTERYTSTVQRFL